MEALLGESITNVLADNDGNYFLEDAAPADLASYAKHWCKASNGGLQDDAIPTQEAQRYLTAEVASDEGVATVLQHLDVGPSIGREEFMQAAHLLYSAVRSAQDTLFSRDDFWADAPPATSKRGLAVDKWNSWMIGALAAARGGDVGQDPQMTPRLEDFLDDVAVSIEADARAPPATEEGRTSSVNSPSKPAQHNVGEEEDTIEEGGDTEGPGWKDFDAAFASLAVERRSPASRQLLSAEESFDSANSHIDPTDDGARSDGGAGPSAVQAARKVPAWAAFPDDREQVSLATAGALLATGLEPMAADDRMRCEASYQAKGFPAAGGMSLDEARVLFLRSRLPSYMFDHVLSATGAGPDGRLSQLQFCVFIHIMMGATRGQLPPDGLTPEQAARLVEGTREGFPTALPPRPPLRSEPAHQELPVPAAAPVPVPAEATAPAPAGDVTTSAEPAENGAATARTRAESPCSTSSSLSDTSGRTTGSGLSGSRSLAATFPSMAARMERAVFEDQAGHGHAFLQFRLRTACPPPGKTLDRPFITLSVYDSVGRLVEKPMDSHPGMHRQEGDYYTFDDQALTVRTPLRQLPAGCNVFLELRQWKAREGRFSTAAWSYVKVGFMVDEGPLLSRVRCGPMVLPLFRKPVDVTARKARALATRGPGLQVLVRGVAEV